MRKNRIKLSEFATLSESEIEQRLVDMFQAAVNPTPEEHQEQEREVDEQIRDFETCYKMSSYEMKRLLRSGQIQEDSDICDWLMLLNIKNRFQNKQAA